MHPQDMKDQNTLYTLGKHKEFPQVFQDILAPRFTTSEAEIFDLEVTGLLPSTITKTTQRLNLVEMVWLRLVSELRKVNADEATIKKLKIVAFMTPNIVDGLHNNELFKESFTTSLINLAKADGNSNPEKNILEALKNPEVLKKLEEIKVTFLSLWLLDILLLDGHYSIVITSSGEVIPVKTSFIDRYSSNEEINEQLHSTHLSISLNKIVSELIPGCNSFSNADRLYTLTADEIQAMELIRSGNARSVEVIMDKEQNIESFNLTELKKKVNKAARLTDHIKKGEHQEINIRTQDGNIVHFENKRRIKPKNNGTGS